VSATVAVKDMVQSGNQHGCVDTVPIMCLWSRFAQRALQWLTSQVLNWLARLIDFQIPDLVRSHADIIAQLQTGQRGSKPQRKNKEHSKWVFVSVNSQLRQLTEYLRQCLMQPCNWGVGIPIDGSYVSGAERALSVALDLETGIAWVPPPQA
jgi:hypothetical protein